ncbi:hypothetical protein [Nitrosomonas sp. Nm166]|uniref:hypothetical protein n=1 Tax=Nitrosomonas sp. Nm166 TaxID=1881054 RepID=UPI0008E8684E|nr:hypothetical protein [Nitrosomonas sp. Nm166]SFE22639.1 hypothetical protein SAMN05428977_101014 [Nitrosomonas sp. Nm166]
MAIDWDKFQGELDKLIDEAGDKTDEKLAGKISTITHLTDEEVKRLFPDPADVKKLAELMEIVKREGDRNNKINQIVTNAEEFGGIILTLMSKFV